MFKEIHTKMCIFVSNEPILLFSNIWPFSNNLDFPFLSLYQLEAQFKKYHFFSRINISLETSLIQMITFFFFFLPYCTIEFRPVYRSEYIRFSCCNNGLVIGMVIVIKNNNCTPDRNERFCWKWTNWLFSSNLLDSQITCECKYICYFYLVFCSVLYSSHTFSNSIR